MWIYIAGTAVVLIAIGAVFMKKATVKLDEYENEKEADFNPYDQN